MPDKRKLSLALALTLSSVLLFGCISRLPRRDLLFPVYRAEVDLAALNRLRAGDTNGAIERLERDLNNARSEIEINLRHFQNLR